MSWKTETFDRAAALIKRLPDGAHFELGSTPDEIDFQAYTRGKFRAIRAAFPGAIWKKEWVRDCEWWTFRAEYEGFKLKVYACRENPPTCKAITERRKIKVPVLDTPATYKEEEKEVEVIVGWDCGQTGEAEEVPSHVIPQDERLPRA